MYPVSAKYVVVIVGSALTWREQVDVKMRKASNYLLVCKRACGAWWGLKPNMVQWLYVTIVRPTISFASLYGGLADRQLAPRGG